MKRLPIVPHLSHEEIDRRYRGCSDGPEKSRWHVLWLVTRPDQPLSASKAAELVGFTPSWGRTILKRYNASGPDALAELTAMHLHRRTGRLHPLRATGIPLGIPADPPQEADAPIDLEPGDLVILAPSLIPSTVSVYDRPSGRLLPFVAVLSSATT